MANRNDEALRAAARGLVDALDNGTDARDWFMRVKSALAPRPEPAEAMGGEDDRLRADLAAARRERDEANEEVERVREDYRRLASEMIYEGNSISWIHSKAENYKRALLQAWNALAECGKKADGNTPLADAIRQHFAALARPVAGGDGCKHENPTMRGGKLYRCADCGEPLGARQAAPAVDAEAQCIARHLFRMARDCEDVEGGVLLPDECSGDVYDVLQWAHERITAAHAPQEGAE